MNNLSCHLRKLAVCCCLVFAPSISQAEIVLTYTGSPYDSAESPFTMLDMITGTAIFANVGDSAATSVTLSTSLNGNPGFSITNSGSVGAFTWSGNSLSVWSVDVFDDVFGAAGFEEQLGVSSSALTGDFAAIDIGGVASFAIGGPGTWSSASAVPEPSSMAFAATLFAVLITKMRRKRMIYQSSQV